MKSIFIISFLISAFQCFGQQNIEAVIKAKTDQLIKEKIENFFFFEIQCVGFEKASTNKLDCAIEDSDIFIFWRNQEKNFFSKVNLCENEAHETSNEVFDFYSENYKQISKEKVRSYYIDENTFILPQHTCIKRFKFKDSTENEFDEFDLTSDEEKPNVNSDENRRLKIVQLAKLCENTIFPKS